MPYTVKGHCIYKKSDNSKVGCTKGNINKYLVALHANTNESMVENNKFKGGKADKLTTQNIADKFNLDLDIIKYQICKGITIEMEHTSDKEKATEIATDHVSEITDYYDRLEKMENKASKELNLKDVTENTKSLIKRLIREEFKVIK